MSSSFYQKKSSDQPSHLKNFTVGAPEEFQSDPFANQTPRELSPEERMELNRLRQNQVSPKLSDYAKKRGEILANIGRMTKDVSAEGITFSLKTLKAKETREAALAILQCANDVDAGYEMRRQYLARAIYAIDGQDMALIVGGDDLNLRLELIDELEESAIVSLYKEHLLLKQEALDKFAPKTEADAKGVLEDLKK